MMSVRLTTPMGWPASSITGAALYPESTRKATTSANVAPPWIDTGLGVIRSRAVSPVRPQRTGTSVSSAVLITSLPSCPQDHPARHLPVGEERPADGGRAPRRRAAPVPLPRAGRLGHPL